MAGPSRVRGRVLAFTFALTVITYLDRVCISAAAPAIMAELHISVLQMSAVFSAFTLAYSIFEIPSGWLGDVRGPRRVLTRIVLWWSAFTMLTGAAQGFRSLVAIRFLFGVGEAGAFPNIIRSFARWFPRRERGRASGIMFLGSRAGRHAVGADRAAAHRSPRLARDFVVFGVDRPRLGGGLGGVVPRPAGRAPGRQRRRSSRGSSRTRSPDRDRGGRDAVAGAVDQPERLGDLRDVFRVRLRPVLLSDVAADLPGHRAGILRARQRIFRVAPVPAGGHRRRDRRVAHRSARATSQPARRALRRGLHRVCDHGRAAVRLDADRRRPPRRRCCWRWRSDQPTCR